MDPIHEQSKLLTRRYFFGRAAAGIGTAALASLLNERLLAGRRPAARSRAGFWADRTFPPRPSGSSIFR